MILTKAPSHVDPQAPAGPAGPGRRELLLMAQKSSSKTTGQQNRAVLLSPLPGRPVMSGESVPEILQYSDCCLLLPPREKEGGIVFADVPPNIGESNGVNKGVVCGCSIGV